MMNVKSQTTALLVNNDFDLLAKSCIYYMYISDSSLPYPILYEYVYGTEIKECMCMQKPNKIERDYTISNKERSRSV